MFTSVIATPSSGTLQQDCLRNTLRWFDLPTRSAICAGVLDNEICSCEMTSLAIEFSSQNDSGGGL